MTNNTPSALVKQNYQTAEEFLAAIRRSNEQWWPEGADWSPWVFRGIGDDENWRLLPSAWRSNGNALSPLLEQLVAAQFAIPFGHGEGETIRRRFEWESAELEALFQFAELANSVGFSVPADSFHPTGSPLNIKRLFSIDEQFSHESRSLKIAALAQHHGIPTRLLDWTESPLVAAFFASTAILPEPPKTLCVWALNTDSLKRHGVAVHFKGMSVRLHRPSRGENAYLHSQGGVFTEVHGGVGFFLKHERWPGLEDIFEDQEGEPVLIGHALVAQEVPRLARLLEREGIHIAALMPSLDNVALTVKNRWVNRAIEMQARWHEGEELAQELPGEHQDPHDGQHQREVHTPLA